MAPDKDPLSRLIVDHVQANRDLLATALDSIVLLDPPAGRFLFAPQVRGRLGNRGLIVAALLARKAIALLTKDFREGATPRDLEGELAIAGGTLRPTLKRLSDEGLIVRREGRYEIPNHLIEEAGLELRNRG